MILSNLVLKNSSPFGVNYANQIEMHYMSIICKKRRDKVKLNMRFVDVKSDIAFKKVFGNEN
ncbi:MAG: hypothetical protein L3V56_07365, partial [Candidatus Magnetoovum sp. WYHC-5]|nr:hypothetical protein [Candidatus Magnetoovum sp. WYHC-5]